MWAVALGSLALAVGLAGLLLRRPRKMMPRRYGKLIAEVEGASPAREGKPAYGPVYRNVMAKEVYPTLDGITTLYELFTTSVDKYPDNVCLGHRPQVLCLLPVFGWLTTLWNFCCRFVTIGIYGGCRWTARQAPTSGSRIGR